MTPASPIVSVVVPAYNAAQFLSTAIATVQAQTWTDWELIIVNDGSTDQTPDIVQPYLQQDDRLRLISQPNQGVSVARNRGVAESRGEFVAFLDVDDQWLPEKLQVHLEHLTQHPELGLSFDRVAFLDATGQLNGQVASAAFTGLTPARFLYENPTTTTSSWVVRRAAFEQVGGFIPGMSYSEDLEWLFRCSLHWPIVGLNQILTYYRTTGGGLSSDLYRMEAGWQGWIAYARKQAPELVQQHFKQAQAAHLRYLARRAIRVKAPAKVGLDFMLRALQSDACWLLREPRRTGLTLIAVLGYGLLTLGKSYD